MALSTYPTSESNDLACQPNTIGRDGKRKWIYAVHPKGRWQVLRNFATLLLLILFYGTPWLTLNDVPFIRLSFLSSSFILFGNYILPHEIFHFVLLALLLVVTLFFASALIGRAWCGYACPQTIFIEQILGRIENFVEGSPAKRMLHDSKDLTLNIVLRKVIKHALFILVSLSFAFTLVAYFTGPEMLLGGTSPAALWAIGILTVIAWFNGGYWR